MNEHGGAVHLEEGVLLAHLDGELAGERSAGVAAHLSECAECRRRWEELSTISALLGSGLEALDTPPPRRSANEIRRLARERGRTDGDGSAEHLFGFRRGVLWKAAALVLGLATAASAVVPGSPVREWITDTVRTVSEALTAGAGPGAVAPPGDEAITTARPQDAGLQGVTIPVTDSAVVTIPDPASGLRIRVRSIRGSLLSVTGREARYRVGSGVIEVTEPGTGPLRVGLPESAAAVRITAGGTLLVAGTGRDLRLLATRIDTTDNAYMIHVPDDQATGDAGGSER